MLYDINMLRNIKPKLCNIIIYSPKKVSIFKGTSISNGII